MKNITAEKDFLSVFEQLSTQKSYRDYLNKLIINEVNFSKIKKTIEIKAVSNILIPIQIILTIEESFKRFFRVNHITLKVHFDTGLSLEQFMKEYWGSLIFCVNRRLISAKVILQDCDWTIEGKTFHINLKNKGAEILKESNCDTYIANLIKEWTGTKLSVKFINAKTDISLKEKYLEFKSKEEEIIQEKASAKIIDYPLKQNQDKTTGVTSKNFKPGDVIKIIKGKSINDEVEDINTLRTDSGRVCICGDIFSSIEAKEIKGNRYIIIFDVTDYNGSINVKMFIKNNELSKITDVLKKGIRVKVRGDVQYDTFARDIVIMARDIVEVCKEERMDNAENKRVELHLHTQMSSLDATSPVDDLIATAARWGHKAIAITDHGVVQAFPDAKKAADKYGIKVIYGVECYLVDDSRPIIYNPDNYSKANEYVVLDLETTGLRSNTDKIIEIGAVKIKNNEIIDQFSAFVNPGVPIPGKIIELTGITDDMVRDAEAIEFVLPRLIDFIGDATIVAHNSPFDIGFIKKATSELGIVLENAVIDTLQLSRQMFPEMKRHKLDVVAKHLKINIDNHHRALDDARTTAQILMKCLKILNTKNIKSLDDIQNAFSDKVDVSKGQSYHAIILVKNQTGLRNLYRIISKSHLDYFYKRPRVPRKLLMAYREGLILASACEAGELYRAVLEGKSERAIKSIAEFYDLLEIQPLGNNQFLINSGQVNNADELKHINKKIVDIGTSLGKPVIATGDVHFLNPVDEVFRRILMCGQGYSDAEKQPPLYLRTTDDMLNEFNYLGEEKAYEVVVENTNMVADLVEDIKPIPDGTFPPKIDGAEKQVEEDAIKRAIEIYGDPLPELVKTRLEKELNSIIKNGFSVMYIIAQKLVNKSLNDGYLVGSRGSVGSSFTAYTLGITEVNSLPAHYICENIDCKYSEFIGNGEVDCGFDLPEKDCPKCGRKLQKDGYDIPFETFLGFDGDKEPDIDLNFSGEYQPIAHKYTEELFGKGHVFRAGTIATVASKTAFGFVKGYIDERNMTSTNAEIRRLIEGCSGIKRTTGQHPGGVMIVPHDHDIYEFCPIQRPADDTSSEIITTHFDYHSISGKLLKLDILGHDDPTVIKMLEDITGVNAREIPIGEKRTMGIFSSTQPLGIKPEDIKCSIGTFGIPEFGTKFVRQMLLDTKPTTFSELVRISGLSHGTDVWINNAQDLVRVGTTTLSEVISTRDDIMLYLIHAGLEHKIAFKIMEDVRKGKGLLPEYEETMRKINIPSWYIDSCKKIKYMFPKAHAAAYVMMAFRIAWFKVYYPEAFYATYFTVRADDFDAEIMTRGQELVQSKIDEYEMKQRDNSISQKEKNVLTILEVANEMYARGFKFHSIDLMESDAARFLVTADGIRPPFNALQGLGSAAAQNIVSAREEDKFLSIDDLRVRAKLSKSVIEVLDKCGSLKELPESNQISLFG